VEKFGCDKGESKVLDDGVGFEGKVDLGDVLGFSVLRVDGDVFVKRICGGNEFLILTTPQGFVNGNVTDDDGFGFMKIENVQLTRVKRFGVEQRLDILLIQDLF
jgi:hypothetical protein